MVVTTKCVYSHDLAFAFQAESYISFQLEALNQVLQFLKK